VQRVAGEILQREFSIFTLRPMNNDWAIDTGFELRKKNLILLEKDAEAAEADNEGRSGSLHAAEVLSTLLGNFAGSKRTLIIVGSLLRNRINFVAQLFSIFCVHVQHILLFP
jgi:hypothetical protein